MKINKIIIRCLVLMIVVFMFCGCTKKEETIIEDKSKTNETSDDTVKTSYNVIEKIKLEDNYTSDKYHDAIDIYNKYAVNLFKNVSTKGKNDLISPLSLYYALAITTNAAANDSKLLLENYLGMSTNDLNNFLKDFSSEHSNIRIANGLWFNTAFGENLNSELEKTINAYYKSGVFQRDFQSNTKNVVDDINKWASDNTNGYIKDIIKEDDIDDDTLFYILNALSIGNEWIYPYNKELTYLEDFIASDGSSSPSEMLHKCFEGYYQDDYCEAMYGALHDGSSFMAIVPKGDMDVYDYLNNYFDENTFSKIQKNFIFYDNIDEANMTADMHLTNLSFPKYKYETSYEISETLKKLGLSEVFDVNKADFSNMSDGSLPKYIKNIKQHNVVEVDEEKAVASSLTIVEGGVGAAGMYTIKNYIVHDVEFNKPFIYAFLLPNYETNDFTIAFLGVYAKAEGINDVIPLEVIADTIKVRSSASAIADTKIINYQEQKVLCVNKGDKVYAYEKKENEGYTWYRIGDSSWIADKNGEWVKELN